MDCKICTHQQRAEIEYALLHGNTDPSVSVEDIAKEFEVDANELRKHALFHTPLGFSEDDTDSIAKKLKLRESDMLTEVALEYLVTLKGVGRRINKYVNEQDESIRLEKLMSKPMVDLYLGLGAEVRQTVRAIADIDNILNGPKEDNTSGLAALAAAINGSK